LGEGDVDRDIQFAQFRDRNIHGTDVLRVKKRFLGLDLDFTQTLKPADFQELAAKIAVLHNDPNPTLRRCGKLAIDLEKAFGYCDSSQRLRTNIMYLYATYDQVHQLRPHPSLEAGINNILKAYAAIVYLDELNYDSQSFKISQTTNQALHQGLFATRNVITGKIPPVAVAFSSLVAK
jgi:hypothetical protein